MKKKYWLQIAFTLSVIIIGWIYGYQNSLFFRPQSIHAWRQADCASITLNYYQTDMNPLHPQVHNQTSDGGNSGYAATSEMPVLYYFSALLYKLFGPHEFIIRLLNMLIFFIGLLYLFKTLQLVLKDSFWAFIVPLLMFTSPVLVYYGNNFLSNVSAFSFVFIAWYYFVKYLEGNKPGHLILMMLFFLFAGLFKLPALMSLFAITGYLVLKTILPRRYYSQPDVRHKGIFYAGVVLVLLIIGSWIIYAHRYNTMHECYYFSTTVFPIWSMSAARIKDLLLHVWTHWRVSYFHDSMHVLFGLMLIFTLVHIKKLKKIHIALGVFLALQFAFFVIMQFQTFYNHDYYTINLNILPLFILVSGLILLRDKYENLFHSKVFKALFVLLLVVNIHHASGEQAFRYNGWPNKYYSLKQDIYSIEPYLRELGMTPEDKVIFIPDGTNVSLYLMNQKGWTQYTDARFNRGESLKYNQDAKGIQASVDRGAKYLIVNNIADLETYAYIKPRAGHLAGKYHDVLIFDLTDSSRNFYPDKKSVIDSLFCNAEQIKSNKFLCTDSSHVIGHAKMQSTDYAFGGDFSCKIFADMPYGFAWEIPGGCSAGDMFEVTVWRYGSEKARIIASADDASFFYLNNSEVIDERDGWEKLMLSFTIPGKMKNRHLKIYLYNPDPAPAWFDDYRIIWYGDPFQGFYD